MRRWQSIPHGAGIPAAELLVVGLIVAAVLLGLVRARGQSSVLFGTPETINGTSNSAPVAVGTVFYPRGTFLVQHGSLGSTNALTLYAQVSLDGTNFLTISTWRPTNTSAATETFTLGYGSVTNHLRVQVVTTNAVTVNAIYTP